MLSVVVFVYVKLFASPHGCSGAGEGGCCQLSCSFTGGVSDGKGMPGASPGSLEGRGKSLLPNWKITFAGRDSSNS